MQQDNTTQKIHKHKNLRFYAFWRPYKSIYLHTYTHITYKFTSNSGQRSAYILLWQTGCIYLYCHQELIENEIYQRYVNPMSQFQIIAFANIGRKYLCTVFQMTTSIFCIFSAAQYLTSVHTWWQWLHWHYHYHKTVALFSWILKPYAPNFSHNSR